MEATAATHKAPYARRWWALLVLTTSLLIIALDNTILNVALPTLVRELDASASQLQWMVDAYVVVFAGLLLTMGALGDRFGRRGALSLGLGIFGVMSVVAAFSGSANQLISARAVMGIGGALIMPSTLSIITNIFPPNERGRAIGIWAGVSGAGIAFGPLVGGWLLEHYWWGSVFLINVPIVIAGLVGGRLLVPTSKDPKASPLDPLGVVLSIAGLATLVYAIIEAPNHGWADPWTLTLFAVAVAILVFFVIWELRATYPMLDVRFFENPRFTAASIAITMVFFAMFGSMFVLTQYFQFVLGYSPLEAGARLAPVALVMAVAAPTSARVVEKIGTKIVVTTGLVVVAISLVLFAGLTVDTSYPELLWRLAVLGVGMGFVMAPATESIMGSLPLAKAGVGSAVNDTTRQVGGALGVAILGSLVASHYTSAVASIAAQLPAQAAAFVSDSVGGALGVAKQLPPALASQVAATARSAFVESMDLAVYVAAGIAVLGAAVAGLFLPAHETRPAGGEWADDYEDPTDDGDGGPDDEDDLVPAGAEA